MLASGPRRPALRAAALLAEALEEGGVAFAAAAHPQADLCGASWLQILGYGRVVAKFWQIFAAKFSSFSAVSAPIFGRQYAFCNIFHNLQAYLA